MSTIEDGHEREPAEVPAEHTGVDGSVGSDTETGKTTASDTSVKDVSEIKHHVRSNSVKKPTTFKAVSVTKNFLAKANPAPAAKGNGDKGGTGKYTLFKPLTDVCSCITNGSLWNHRTAGPSTSACRKNCQWPASISTQVYKCNVQKRWR